MNSGLGIAWACRGGGSNLEMSQTTMIRSTYFQGKKVFLVQFFIVNPMELAVFVKMGQKLPKMLIWQKNAKISKKCNFSIFRNLRYRYFEAKQIYFANTFFENYYFLMPKYQFFAFKNEKLETKKSN